MSGHEYYPQPHEGWQEPRWRHVRGGWQDNRPFNSSTSVDSTCWPNNNYTPGPRSNIGWQQMPRPPMQAFVGPPQGFHQLASFSEQKPVYSRDSQSSLSYEQISSYAAQKPLDDVYGEKTHDSFRSSFYERGGAPVYIERGVKPAVGYVHLPEDSRADQRGWEERGVRNFSSSITEQSVVSITERSDVALETSYRSFPINQRDQLEAVVDKRHSETVCSENIETEVGVSSAIKLSHPTSLYRPLTELRRERDELQNSAATGNLSSDNKYKNITGDQYTNLIAKLTATAEGQRSSPYYDPTLQNILQSIGFDFELSKRMQETAEQRRARLEAGSSAEDLIKRSFGIEGSGISSFLTSEGFRGGCINYQPLRDALLEAIGSNIGKEQSSEKSEYNPLRMNDYSPNDNEFTERERREQIRKSFGIEDEVIEGDRMSSHNLSLIDRFAPREPEFIKDRDAGRQRFTDRHSSGRERSPIYDRRLSKERTSDYSREILTTAVSENVRLLSATRDMESEVVNRNFRECENKSDRYSRGREAKNVDVKRHSSGRERESDYERRHSSERERERRHSRGLECDPDLKNRHSRVVERESDYAPEHSREIAREPDYEKRHSRRVERETDYEKRHSRGVERELAYEKRHSTSVEHDVDINKKGSRDQLKGRESEKNKEFEGRQNRNCSEKEQSRSLKYEPDPHEHLNNDSKRNMLPAEDNVRRTAISEENSDSSSRRCFQHASVTGVRVAVNRCDSRRTVLLPDEEREFENRKKQLESTLTLPRITASELEEMLRVRDERTKRLVLLERQLERLRKTQNEMLRRKQRERDGHRDPLILENNLLQDEIEEKMKQIRRAVEENNRRIEACQLQLGIGTSAAPSLENQTATQQQQKHRHSSATTSSKHDSASNCKSDSPDDKSSLVYEYGDLGGHWCRLCAQEFATVNDYFKHVQSDQPHLKMFERQERPWLSLNQKDQRFKKVKIVKGGTIKGAEFISSAPSAFFCALCREFFGDLRLSQQHLCSQQHQEKYDDYLKDNSFYEKTLHIEMKAARLLRQDSKHQHLPKQHEKSAEIKERDSSERLVETRSSNSDVDSKSSIRITVSLNSKVDSYSSVNTQAQQQQHFVTDPDRGLPPFRPVIHTGKIPSSSRTKNIKQQSQPQRSYSGSSSKKMKVSSFDVRKGVPLSDEKAALKKLEIGQKRKTIESISLSSVESASAEKKRREEEKKEEDIKKEKMSDEKTRVHSNARSFTPQREPKIGTASPPPLDEFLSIPTKERDENDDGDMCIYAEDDEVVIS